MSNVIHRTNRINYKLERRFQVHTPSFVPPASADWIVNPDLSAVDGIIDEIYWKTVGETVVAMDGGEQASVDLSRIDDLEAATKAVVVKRLLPVAPLAGINYAVDASGLVLTVDITDLVDNHQETVVADASLTKTVKVCCVYNETSEVLSVEVFEKTDGLYSDLASNEILVADMGEWTVAPLGTTLTAV